MHNIKQSLSFHHHPHLTTAQAWLCFCAHALGMHEREWASNKGVDKADDDSEKKPTQVKVQHTHVTS